jgi:hypothetical protein
MGTVFNRGTKDNPSWYVGYRANGRWVYKPSRQPTKALSGHSSPVVTKRFYDHYVRGSFSQKPRAGLGLGEKQQGGKVVPMKTARGATR